MLLNGYRNTEKNQQKVVVRCLHNGFDFGIDDFTDELGGGYLDLRCRRIMMSNPRVAVMPRIMAARGNPGI